MNPFIEMEFDLKFDAVCKSIRDKGYKTVLLQFPDGLKQNAVEVAGFLEEATEANVIIWADSCYGACDPPYLSGDSKIDLIVQFGHAEMPNLKSSVPQMFIEAHSALDVLPVVKKAQRSLSKKVGIITTVQHIHKINEVREFLRKNGFEVYLGKAHGRILHSGQILGCNLSSATTISHEVDNFLYIGGGNFHPLGVALATHKPVVVADPYSNEIRDVEDIKERLLRQRFGAITKAKDLKTFGIIVSTKPGQMRMNTAFELRRVAKRHGKKASILLLNDINSHKFIGLEIDALVNCACPRIAIDDFMTYRIPILTPFEFEVVLDERKWEEYRFEILH